jgi:DNA gyrase subunit A
MATNIPPHNLNEIVDACLHLLKNPEATIDELMEIVPAPDFPTAGIIYGLNGVREGYRTGRGKVVMRAKCHFEDIDKGARQSIIVDEIPYQVNKKTLLERIAELVHEKKIDGISHIQDESDKSGMRVVIELKRGEVPEVVLNNLYKQTQLQDTFGINMVALIDGQPKLCNLKQLLDDLPRAPARSGHAAHGVRAAQGARTRPCARRPGGGAGQHRRVHRDHQDQPDAAGGQGALMSKSWDSSMVREMLARAEADTPAAAGLPPRRAAGAATACRPTACTA